MRIRNIALLTLITNIWFRFKKKKVIKKNGEIYQNFWQQICSFIYWRLLFFTLVWEISWPIIIKNKYGINVDIIHHECGGDPLQKNYREHKTVNNVDFEKYPEKEKTKTVSAIFRNIKRDDLWIKRDLMI